MDNKHIPHYLITLHVGMGTFAPIDETNIKEKKLHHEWYEISNKTLRCIDTSKCEGKELVAVGTTVVRTLESFAISKSQYPITNQQNGFVHVSSL